MATLPEQIEIGGKQVKAQRVEGILKKNVFGSWTLKLAGKPLEQVLNYPKGQTTIWLFIPAK